MTHRTDIGRRAALALLAGLALAPATDASAQTRPAEFKVGQQPGLIYLPLYVVAEQGLLEKQTRLAGIPETRLQIVMLGSASAISETLLAGSVDAAAGAITPLLTLWDKTRGAQKVKAICTLSNSVLYLNTNDPDIKSLKDFGENDRIALSGVGFSMQATLLQMAAAQAFGPDQATRLDARTVSMPHPEGLAALLSGKGKVIAGHFTTAPFQNLEVRDPHIHTVLTSKDILGGDAPAALVFATQKVYDSNLKLLSAFVAAVTEANAWIAANPKAAAELYLKREPQKLSVDEVSELLTNRETSYGTLPHNSLKIAQFMAKLGRLKEAPRSWKDYFFPIVDGQGS